MLVIPSVVLIQLSILWTSCLIDYCLAAAAHRTTTSLVVVRIALDECAHLLLPTLVWLLSALPAHLSIGASNGNINKDIVRIYVYVMKYRNELIASMVVGVIIDIDHVIEARSLSLFAVTNLDHRPIGHSLLCCILVVLAVRLVLKNSRIPIVVQSGYMTHLLRDATRRGLWMGQELVGGSGLAIVTNPIPRSAVLALYCVVLPLMNRYMVLNAHRLQRSESLSIAS